MTIGLYLVLDLVGVFAQVLDEVMDLDDAFPVATHLDAFVYVIDEWRDPLAAAANQPVLASVDAQNVQVVRRGQHRYQKLLLRHQLRPPQKPQREISNIDLRHPPPPPGKKTNLDQNPLRANKWSIILRCCIQAYWKARSELPFSINRTFC